MGRRVVVPNAENASKAELHMAAKAAATRRGGDRCRAIAALIMGIDHDSVAELFGAGRRTLRRWILAFNEQGIDGLLDKKRSGRPRKISGDQVDKCLSVLDQPEMAGQVHWTGVKFHGYLRNDLDIEVGYSTVIRFLHEQDYRLKVPQPWPDRQDETLRKAFVERLKEWLTTEDLDIWFCDEMGVEGDPRPRRRWDKKGERTRITKNGDHIRMNVTGMICPRTGEFYALEFSHSDGVVFQTFLNHAGQDVHSQRTRNLLIADNASWHKNKSINWGRFEPIFLPPYSPDLNPIEKLWLVLKAEWFSDFTAKTKDALILRLDSALRWLINRQPDNHKTCSIRTKI